jgi:hypothetical protein
MPVSARQLRATRRHSCETARSGTLGSADYEFYTAYPIGRLNTDRAWSARGLKAQKRA